MNFKFLKDCKICYELLIVLDKEDKHLYSLSPLRFAVWEEQYVPQYCKIHRKYGPYATGCTMGIKQIAQYLTFRIKRKIRKQHEPRITRISPDYPG